MNNPKLLEAIQELESQRTAIEAAIKQMKATYAALNPDFIPAKNETLNGYPVEDPRDVIDPYMPRNAAKRATGSYVDESVMAIESAGGRLHINDIVKYIQSMRNTEVKRASVESSLLGEMKAAKKKGRRSRIIRVSPGTFDTPRPMAMAS